MGSIRIMPLAAAVIAALLQLVLAPALTIGSATPNFIVAVTVAYITFDHEEPHYVYAFVMGLVSDLLCGTPIGAASLGLLICSYAVPYAIDNIGADTPVMTLLIIALGMLAHELVFGIFCSIAGLLGPFDAVTAIIVPYTVYNAILAFVAYFVFVRLGTGRRPRGGTTMTNVRFN